jgi:putative SOS response-associated peptidase YedK
MCGRYSLFAPVSDLEDRFDATVDFDYEPRYNAAPRQSLPVITNEAPERVSRMDWGLIPQWAEQRTDHEHINARAESLAETPSFREAYETRRCLVPADGFYEWATTDGDKTPYRIHPGDADIFAMAGLWERWQPPQRQAGLGEFGSGGGAGEESPPTVETFTIVTTQANDAVRPIHNRMPVILEPEAEATWLHGERGERAEVLDPYGGSVQTTQVSTRVNDPSNDDPTVVEPVAE